MAVVTITIDIGKGERIVTINPDDLSMGFFEDVEEAQESGKVRPIMRAYGELLGFTREEVRALKPAQFSAILTQATAAMNKAIAVPNGSAGASG